METTLGHEILTELMQLMERSCIDALQSPTLVVDQDETTIMEDTLAHLKILNARYDKDEAILQIKCLMQRYNIQLDQLVDRHGIT